MQYFPGEWSALQTKKRIHNSIVCATDSVTQAATDSSLGEHKEDFYQFSTIIFDFSEGLPLLCLCLFYLSTWLYLLLLPPLEH